MRPLFLDVVTILDAAIMLDAAIIIKLEAWDFMAHERRYTMKLVRLSYKH